MKARFHNWIRRQMPKREELESNRWAGPLARRHELWRFTRRSVPRGVAIGLLVGIFALIPGVQIIGATLMCIPCRGNVPLAAAMTFLSNPATTPFLLAASLYVGNLTGYKADLAAFNDLYSHGAGPAEWITWLLSDAAPALLMGLFIIATLAGAIGYVISYYVWKEIVARRRRRRAAQLDPAG